MSTEMTEDKVDVLVIGGGPAGLAAAQTIAASDPTASVLLVEAGPPVEDRTDGAHHIVNGILGAGFWSDRKFSVPPAGSGLRVTNVYMLRRAYASVLGALGDAATSEDTKGALSGLATAAADFLGRDEPAEASQWAGTTGTAGTHVKVYPCITIPTMEEARELANAFIPRSAPNLRVLTNTRALIRGLPCPGRPLAFDKTEDVTPKWIVCATGRLGADQLQPLIPNCLENRRLEFGVRLILTPAMAEGLALLQADTPDPKVIIERMAMVHAGCDPVKVQVRTFCACLPRSKDEHGYCVQSKDQVTGTLSWSGSSSFHEAQARAGAPHVIPRSNVGVTMRVCDPLVIQRLMQDGFPGAKEPLPPHTMGLHEEEDLAFLKAVCPTPLLGLAFYGCLQDMVTMLLGGRERTPFQVVGPCVEGTSHHPVTGLDFQCSRIPRLYFAGDVVGHTRGLIQGFVTGQLAGQNLALARHLDALVEAGIIEAAQSPYNAATFYGKLQWDAAALRPVSAMHAAATAMRGMVTDDTAVLAAARAILEGIRPAAFVGATPTMGVLYELHPFFLGASTQPRLDVLEVNSVLDYLLMVNSVDMEALAEDVMRMMPELGLALTSDMALLVFNRIKNAVLRACLLSLRMRETFVPVMQPALKIMPFTKGEMDAGRVPPGAGATVAAIMMACLDTHFKACIETQGLDLVHVRTKIETQQPAVIVEDPVYLECHVKLSAPHLGGFEAQEVFMHNLSGLVEGPSAMVPGLMHFLSGSCNLLKHPDHGRQMFLTFRTDTAAEMETMRRGFTPLFTTLMEMRPDLFPVGSVKFIPDAEFVVFDSNRALDDGWFPIRSGFCPPGWDALLARIINPDTRRIIMATGNPVKIAEIHASIPDIFVGMVPPPADLPPVPTGEPGDPGLLRAAVSKAKAVFEQVRRPVYAEEAGLICGPSYSTGTWPGPQTQSTIDDMGLEAFADMVHGRTAAIAAGVLVDHCGKVAKAESIREEGYVVETPRGDTGFGWDSIFALSQIPDKPTFAQDPSQKTFRAQLNRLVLSSDT